VIKMAYNIFAEPVFGKKNNQRSEPRDKKKRRKKDKMAKASRKKNRKR